MPTTKTAVLALVLLATIMFPAVLTFANAQTNHTVEEQIVGIAQKAGDQIQNLITHAYAEPNATEKIQNANLTDQFEGNLTLYQEEGLAKLSEAQTALKNAQYTVASDSALQALEVFRNVYGSLQSIMKTSGITSQATLSNQEIIDAINSELQRVGTLNAILPANTSQNTLNLLQGANQTLLNAQTLAQKGETAAAQTEYLRAKQDITQIYQNLKTQAQQTNNWRLSVYCQTLQQQIQERFAYGKQNGIDFSAALSAKGYQSEAQFMAALQTHVQNAQTQGTLQDAVAQCQLISQMVQQMEQVLNQEISNQQQGQANAGGAGVGGDGAGNSGGTGSSGGSGNQTKAGKS
jgi:uncharacterized membrane protein YgcG